MVQSPLICLILFRESDHVLRYLRTYSLALSDDPPLCFSGIAVRETTLVEPRKAHLICDNLITKQVNCAGLALI